MPFTKQMQDRLEAALADRKVKEQLLNDLDSIISAFNSLLAKLDAEPDLTQKPYLSLKLPGERADGKNDKL